MIFTFWSISRFHKSRARAPATQTPNFVLIFPQLDTLPSSPKISRKRNTLRVEICLKISIKIYLFVSPFARLRSLQLCRDSPIQQIRETSELSCVRSQELRKKHIFQLPKPTSLTIFVYNHTSFDKIITALASQNASTSLFFFGLRLWETSLFIMK